MDVIEGQILDQWHLFQNQKQYGPYRFSTLVEAARAGHLSHDTLIWRPGWASWCPVNSVPGLLAPPEVAPSNRTPADIQSQAGNATSRNYFARHWRGNLSLPR